ncbi:MAG: hypothetical protein DPW16_12320 [Chloroflexi bacterium]|nr:hypothetical protein [Chloroflexota bacterium]
MDQIVPRLITERWVSAVDRGDLPSMLLMTTDESGNDMNDKQIRDEVVTLFLSGHVVSRNPL